MSIDRDLLIAAGRVGGRILIGALDGILTEADAALSSAGVEARRRVARAKERLKKMRVREEETPRRGGDDDGNPFGA